MMIKYCLVASALLIVGCNPREVSNVKKAEDGEVFKEISSPQIESEPIMVLRKLESPIAVLDSVQSFVEFCEQRNSYTDVNGEKIIHFSINAPRGIYTVEILRSDTSDFLKIEKNDSILVVIDKDLDGFQDPQAKEFCCWQKDSLFERNGKKVLDKIELTSLNKGVLEYYDESYIPVLTYLKNNIEQ